MSASHVILRSVVALDGNFGGHVNTGNKESETITRKLVNYAMAGGAALAAMGTANAAVVYTDNPDTILTSNSTNPIFIDSDLNPDYSLDLAADVITEGDTTLGAFANVSFFSLGTNRVVLEPVESNIAALTNGTVVGPGSNFGQNGLLLENKIFAGTPKQVGEWPNDLSSAAFVGLEFDISGNIHYGWARVGAAAEYDTPQSQGVLYDYAYESEPNTAITITTPGGGSEVPEPASLTLFAMGAAGIAALKLRRKRQQQ
jgi:hypothetical protein